MQVGAGGGTLLDIILTPSSFLSSSVAVFGTHFIRITLFHDTTLEKGKERRAATEAADRTLRFEVFLSVYSHK